MVSLGDESGRSGGFFFDSDLRSDTDDLLSEPSLRQPYKRSPMRFYALRTVYSTPLLIILVICEEVTVFLLPHLLQKNDLGDSKTKSFSIILYSHVVIWLLFLFADRFARYQHHISRQQGYLEFYRTTCYLRRIPLMVVSAGNAVLLVMSTTLHDYCTEMCGNHNNTVTERHIATGVLGFHDHTSKLQSTCCPHIKLSHDNYMQIVLSLETAVLLPVLIWYLFKTIVFNRSEPQPDVMDQDFSTTSSLQAHNSPIEIGFRDDTCVDDLMEKQAEMIRYLKEHNAALGKRVMELTTQMHSVNT